MSEARLSLGDPVGKIPGVTPASARKLGEDGCATVKVYVPLVDPRTASGVVTLTRSPGENGSSGR